MSAEEFNAEEEIRMIKEQLRVMRSSYPYGQQPFPGPVYPGKGYGGHPLPPSNNQLMMLLDIALALSEKASGLPDEIRRLFDSELTKPWFPPGGLHARIAEMAFPNTPENMMLNIILTMIANIPGANAVKNTAADISSWPRHIAALEHRMVKIVDEQGLSRASATIVEAIVEIFPRSPLAKDIAPIPKTSQKYIQVARRLIDARVMGDKTFFNLDEGILSFDALGAEETEKEITAFLSEALGSVIIRE